MRFFTCLTVLGLLFSLPSEASDYDDRIPTPEEVLGYEIGTKVTNYAGMEKYLNALAASSPKVVTGNYGEDYENHKLPYVIVSSRKNIKRLERIRMKTHRLTEPEKTTKKQANAIAAEIPATIILNYGTDGNETAGLEAALLTMHHLAASTDQHTVDLLKNAVVILTPLVTPSSHERMAMWTNTFSAMGGNENPDAMEHNPPWGMDTNYNHYLVDINRESMWGTQVTGQALRRFFYKWNPAVFIELHSAYYPFTGPGYAEPVNPLYSNDQKKWYTRYDDAIAESFKQEGWPYASWASWDIGTFYPGFWESLPTLGGAVGITFETIGGGSMGLQYRRRSGELITLRLSADQHFIAAMAVIESTVERKEEILQEYYEFWDSGRKLANSHKEKTFIIEAGRDPARTDMLINSLLANQVEIYKTEKALTANAVEDYFGNAFTSKTFPAGTYIIPVNQPYSRVVLTMLMKDFKLPQVTIDEANKMFDDYQAGKSRRTKGFYDVTSWSMPLTFDVKAYWSGNTISTKGLQKVDTLKLAQMAFGYHNVRLVATSTGGYCFSGDTNTSMAMVIDLIQRDFEVMVATKDFVSAGKDFSRGSYVIRNASDQDVGMAGVLNELSAKHNTTLYPLDSRTASSLDGTDYVALTKSRIAVIAGSPVSPGSFGGIWFMFEQWYGLDFTPVYANDISVNKYDVIIVPEGYNERVGKRFTDRIRKWVNDGGVLVCLGSSSNWAMQNDLVSTKYRERKWPPNPKEGEKQINTVKPAGVILEAQIDPEHYLTLGYQNDPLPVRINTNSVFEPNDTASAPVFFDDSGDFHLSGLYYPGSLPRLAGTPYVTEESLGSGKVILFLQDPNHRLYWHGLTKLFLNSVILSPSFP